MQTTLIPEIIDVTTLCTNCPRKSADDISRDNVLHTIGLMFEGNTELITVYGADSREDDAVGAVRPQACGSRLMPFHSAVKSFRLRSRASNS